jgi:hypothetical protein
VPVPPAQVRGRQLAAGGGPQLAEGIELARSQRPAAGALPDGQGRERVTARRADPDPALVARAGARAEQGPLEADPAGRFERAESSQEPRPAVGRGQVADRSWTALELLEQVGVGRIGRLGRGIPAAGRQLGDEPETFEQPGRQHRAEHEGRWREVVASDPARQPERQWRQERAVGPDPGDDRLGRDVRTRRGLAQDDPERLPPAELDQHGLADLEVAERSRDEIRVRPVAAASRRVDRDLDRSRAGR